MYPIDESGRINRENEIAEIESRINDYESIKDRIFVRLLNYEKNKEDLGDIVCRHTGDIAQVLYIKACEENGVMTSARVQKDLLQIWEKDEAEVFENALVNTCTVTPPRVFRWDKMLLDSFYDGEDFMGSEQAGLLTRGSAGNCISVASRTNGAVAAFLPGVLLRLTALLDSDLYLVFTSIHEVMVHPVTSTDPDIIKESLQQTTGECTPANEFLSDKIYFYGKLEGKLICLEESMKGSFYS